MANKAVLLGINDYLAISDLRGCVNDVHNVERLLVETFHFAPDNVHTLTDRNVTKERVKGEWDWLFRDVSPGDSLVFHLSGHGSYTTDLDDDEPDGVDELVCLYDMDFNDSETYLLDDELREFTRRTPRGVFLTVILDTCHSGTGTRMLIAPGQTRAAVSPAKAPFVDMRASLARMQSRGGTRALFAEGKDPADVIDRILAPKPGAGSRDTVLVRFVEPPTKVQQILSKSGVRSSLRDAIANSRDAGMNHVLFAASEPTQTSADAFIDNDFHGAFSYYFCKLIRESQGRIDHPQVISRVRSAIADAHFSQVPQLEPENTSGPLFRRTREASGSAGQTHSAVAGEVGYEVLEALREIRDLLRSRGPEAARASRALHDRALIYVHGICRHSPGYSDPWWEAMRGHLSVSIARELDANRKEVLWSDLVTRERGVRAAAVGRTREEEELSNLLKEVLADRALRQPVESAPQQAEDEAPTRAPLAGERALLGIPGLDCVDDFVKYLLDDGVRRAVQQRFLDKVEPFLRDGHSIEIISHSWGTVVAYEALRSLDGKTFAGRVHTLFTVGSALSIAPVRNRVVPGDGLRPRHVDKWINLDASGDLVGGSLQNFRIDEEYLNLFPAGCRSFARQVTPSCAHGSYFDSANISVNRDIFARSIVNQ